MSLWRWRPGRLRERVIPKDDGSERTLRIPNGTDMAQCRQILTVVGPLVEARLGPEVWGWRAGRSCAGAIAYLCAQFGQAPSCGLLKADISGLFPNLPLEPLHTLFEQGPLAAKLSLEHRCALRRALDAWAEEPGRGLPQGSPLSPMLANLALSLGLDGPLRAHPMRPRAWMRYGDDLVLADSRPTVHLLALLDGLVRPLGLWLGPDKTHQREQADGRGPLRVLGEAIWIRHHLAAGVPQTTRRPSPRSGSTYHLSTTPITPFESPQLDPMLRARNFSRWPGK